MARFYVWGRGDIPAGSPAGRLFSEAEHSEAAVEAAKAHSFRFQTDGPGPEGPDFALEVECDRAEIDAATRFESRVHGYVAADD